MCDGSIKMMDSLLSILIVLLAFHTHLIVTADRKFGCLLENGLCSPYEFCVNDGVFGRCQRVPVTDVRPYEVSPSALLRLRTLLQKLSLRGLSWQDDATQQAVSKELSKLRRVSYGRSETGPTSGPRKPKPVEVGLSRSLKKYLQDLSFRPRPAAPPIPRLKGDALFSKALYQDTPPAPKAFAPLPAKGPPAAAAPAGLSSAPPGKARVLKLLAALEQHPWRKPPAQRPAVARPPATAQGSLVHGGRWRPLLDTQAESAGPKGHLDMFAGKALFQMLPETSRPQRPKADRLLLKASPSQTMTKEPLSALDETFIQNVVRQLGRHSVNVDALSPKELDQLGDIIADTLQVVDGGGAREDTKREPPSSTAADRDGELSEDTVPQEQQIEEGKPDSSEKNKIFLNKLLEYLDSSSSTDTPSLDIQREEGQPGTPGRAEASGGPSADEKAVGTENVMSRTVQSGATVEKEADPGDSAELLEVERWIQSPAPIAMSAIPAEPQRKAAAAEKEAELKLDVHSVSAPESQSDFGYIITDSDSLSTDEGLRLMDLLARRVKMRFSDFLELSVQGPAVTFKVRPNPQHVSTADVAHAAAQSKGPLKEETGLQILQVGVSDKSKLSQLPTEYKGSESVKFLALTVVSIVCIMGVLLGSGLMFCLRHRSHHKLKEKLTNLGAESSAEATAAYQELCRQRMAVRTAERPEPLHTSRISSVSSQLSDGPSPSPSARSSTSMWSEEPAQSNMDISTGHMILTYMEDHLKNKNRLEKEWEALCSYQAEPNGCTVGLKDQNGKKNRSEAVVVYDHCRIALKAENNLGNSDYINASPIMDHDPRNPAYIATQGPLPSTVADFWQMVWESGCVVIVMLTPVAENGVKQSYHYWPDEGSNLYHIYEVNLVSEHIWCEDFLVRSFYLKNLQTNETRTVTQFHFLTWLNQNVPDSARTLLDFRRKVNKCYRGRSCPIIVHCSDGAGRSGTYILIDMVLNKMAKGAKEIDIAATLEHLRDQRPGMVQTKEQFEFALTAVAEEVNAILKALPQ
ncbi:receptor-type tyrosine-protein phosphatase N2 isoform X1 [Anguilla anguilla]|nr:receptor-type tyrosine-protein phosphatase N2 isoform X1 [Anguilla anguilla]